MKKAIKVLILPSLFLTYAHAIEIKNLSVAVDVAGKQRMFTQRMLKDYAMVGLENNFGNPGNDLKKIVFDAAPFMKIQCLMVELIEERNAIPLMFISDKEESNACCQRLSMDATVDEMQKKLDQ